MSTLLSPIRLVRRFILVARKQGIAVALGQIASYPLRISAGLWERLGIHITPVHFYEPTPHWRELQQRKELWESESELTGIEMNAANQLTLVRNVFPSFKEEYEFPRQETRVPFEFHLNNKYFGPVDAEAAHSMVRYFLPKKIIEVGSGYSTYLLARTCLLNKEVSGLETELFVVDPYPVDTIAKGFPGLSNLRQEKAENIEMDFFLQLYAGDILFIDSTHVVRTGGDVNYLYLEVLPRLKCGVIVHIHDIFLPREYPKEWVFQLRRSWSEQYLLQAFLTYNSTYEVLWCASYMHLHYPQELRAAFTSYDNQVNWPASFWMRRRA
jgi:hypothetical protein